MTTSQQFVLTMIGSRDSNQISNIAASMGLTILMHAAHYRKGTATVSTTADTTSYKQLLYGAATTHMQWSEGNKL